MFHLAAFWEADSGTSTLLDINAVTDGWATVQNNHFIFQENYKLKSFIAFANTIIRGQLNTPHWRFVNQPEIQPVTQNWGNVEGLTFPNIAHPFLTIPRIDEVQFLASTSGVSTTGILGAMFVHDGQMNVHQGDIYPARFTYSATSATGSWVRTNITFDNSLPAGRYQVVGLDLIGNAHRLGRLRFQEYQMLPGVPVRNTAIGTFRDIWRYGNYGKFGEFEQTAQPSLEIFSELAGAVTGSGAMDLVKMR